MQPDSEKPDNIDLNQPKPVQVPEPIVDSSVESDKINVIEETSTTPQLPPKKKHSKKKPLVITLVVIAVLLVACGVGYWWWQSHKAAPVSKTQPTKAKTVEPTPSISDPQLAKFINPTTGEQWLAAPKTLTEQKLFDSKNDMSDTKYYELGSRAGRTIIMSLTQTVGDTVQLYEKAADGSITYIEQPDANAKYDPGSSSVSELRVDIKSDKTIHYDSLSLPKSFTLSSGETVNRLDYANLGNFVYGQEPDATVKKTTLKTLGTSKLIKTERPYVDTGLTAINYSIDLQIGTSINLNYEPIDTAVANYQWNNGVKVTDTIHGIVRGCGSASVAVSRSDVISKSDLVATGKTPKGQVVYEFKDNSNALVAKAYDEYEQYYIDDAVHAVLPLDDFLKQHAIVVYQNASTEWLIYTRDMLAPSGGCAKPVVYLYPTKTENVNVRVGADVKISEPHYDPKTGWNVVARPNGQLSLDGVKYGSLFWEGPGDGVYPAITSGTVVKYADALSTIRSQLIQQGLNATETHDFMEYWQSRIPNKPYVQLVWFNTVQLNELAPLAISPKPDTLIRVFLDMKGLDQPIKIPNQQFKATPRSGFTVVEWGGLSLTRLY